VNVVREDPRRKGLLFAGTERAVYISWDDGDHWQSLRLNMPASSVRDLMLKNDDLIAATHGRGFWILDNVTPLRQFDQKIISAEAVLFRPQTAYRVRWDLNTDTPLPPDFPAGENPPDGAMIDYYLQSAASGPVTLEIKDSAGKTVRRYSSADLPEPPDPQLEIPAYWLRPSQVLSAATGMHRFLWDMHYPPIPGIKQDYPIAAVPHNTPPPSTSPWAMPGAYMVMLTVNGKTYRQPLNVQMDPRVKTPTAGLAQQFRLSQELYKDLQSLAPAADQAEDVQKQLQALEQNPAAGNVLPAIKALEQKLEALKGEEVARPTGAEPPTLVLLRAKFLALFAVLQDVDATPTSQAANAVAELEKTLPPLIERWNTVALQDIRELNGELRRAGLPEVKVEANPTRP
jgi:hypothetical protein